MKPYYQYAHDVVEGKITACNYVKLACKRFLADLQRDDLIFREDIVDHVIHFVSLLKHHRGTIVGQPITFSDWQCFITANIFGFYWKHSGARRFRYSYCEIARKQAKTQMMTALCTYAMLEAPAAQCMLVSNSREQSKIAYEFCEVYAKTLDPSHKNLKIYRDRIKIEETGAFLLVCSADSGKYDGYNPYFCITDEFGSSSLSGGPGSKMRDVMKSGMVHPNAHLATITTAGFDLDGPCYQLRTVCTEILSGVKTDDSMFCVIYCLDPEDDWRDEKNFQKVAPNIGKSVSYDFYREQVQSAINNPGEEAGVRTKTLNEWLANSEAFIPEFYVQKCLKSLDLNEFKNSMCYVGVDLSSVSDLTAISFLFFKDGKHYFYNEYFLPEDSLKQGVNKELYRVFRQKKCLTCTPGNVVDYDYITARIREIQKEYNLRIIRIGYDQWNATQWAIQMQNFYGLEPVSQAIGAFSTGTKAFQKMVLSDQCVIDNSDCTRWNFRNVVLRYDHNQNCKPAKQTTSGGSDQNSKKIDGIIAMINALIVSMKLGWGRGGAFRV